MKQTIRFGAGTLLRLAAVLAVIIAMTPNRTALAQTSEDAVASDAAAPDVGDLLLATDRLIETLMIVDLDNNDVADFDASSDGVAELPLQNFDDVLALPGTDDFDRLIERTLQATLDGGDSTTTGESNAGKNNAGKNNAVSAECAGMAISFDGEGNMVDWALGFGPAHGGGADGVLVDLFPQSTVQVNTFTQENPFVVSERVILIGIIGDQAAGASGHAAAWTASSAGVPLGNGATSTTAINGVAVGEVDMADHVLAGVFAPAGLFPLETTTEVADSFCSTTGWVHFDAGMPLASNVGIAASGLSLAGLAGLIFHARPSRAWKLDEKA